MDKRVTVKWKYRDVKPGVSNHSIKGYIKYITDQVENRQQGTGLFELQNNNNTIGNKEHDSKINNEDLEKYKEYAKNRPGSNGLISDIGIDTVELEKELEKLEGIAWIPIVSTKEETALLYGLDTEEKWVEKARELAESYRKSLGIAKDNYNWVAAFHVKPEADQNKNSDAKSMPHLHFIIWEKEKSRSRPTLSREEINNIRARSASILSHDFMQEVYKERNELRDKIKTSALSLDDYINEIDNLIIDIRLVTKGKGKMNLKEFEKNRDIYANIADKFVSKKPFTQIELEKINDFKITNQDEALRQSKRYSYIVDELEALCDEAVKRPEVKELMNSWYELSNEMRAAQNDLANRQTKKDQEELKRQIMNGILRQAKEASNFNYKISDKVKGMMLERIKEGKIYSNNPVRILEATTSLLKEVGCSKEQNKEMNEKLITNSGLELYKEQVEELIEDLYSNRKIGLNLPTREVYEILRELRIPLARIDTRYRTTNSFDRIANAVINQPVAELVSTQSPEILSPYKVDILKNVLDKTRKPTFSITEYSQMYQDMIESMSGLSQIDDDEHYNYRYR